MPTTLEGWTVEVIESLAEQARGEDKRFDFKSASALRNDKGGRVGPSVAAFANTAGGFLVFGVDERKGQDGWDCNPGPLTTEAPKLINDKIHVDPMPEFPTPMTLPCDDGQRAYYVLHVPASPYSTHSCNGVYHYRTMSGNESMPPEMLRERILGQAQRRSQVKVLLQELDEIFVQACSHRGLDPEGIGPDLVPLDASTMLRMRTELMLPLSGDADAVESLRLAALAIRAFNGQVAVAMLQFADPRLQQRAKKGWSAIMHGEGRKVGNAVNRARLSVGRVFGEEVGNWANSIP